MSGTHPLLHKTQPSFCLAGKVMRCTRIILSIFRKHLHPHGISSSQLSILFVIAKHQSIAQSRLGKVLFLERSTLSRDLQRLLSRQFIIKNTDARPQINITTKGKDFLEVVIPSWNAAMKACREKLGEDGEEALSLVFNQLKS